MHKFRFLVAAAILVIGSHAYAVDGYVSFGYGHGGTQLKDVTGGQDYNTQAGSGLYMVGGVVIPISPTTPHRFEGQLGLGYMFQDDARNEENLVSWSRVPLEALYFYRNTRELFRFGWGITYHVAGKISAKGTNSSAETNVDNALGWVFAAEKLWSPSENTPGTVAFGIRYVSIKYNSSNFSEEADGSTWYLTLSSFSF
jgi:hypothetical protein